MIQLSVWTINLLGKILPFELGLIMYQKIRSSVRTVKLDNFSRLKSPLITTSALPYDPVVGLDYKSSELPFELAPIMPSLTLSENPVISPNHKASRQSFGIITKTSPCNKHPLTPHFYIVKLGFTGIYFFFLFLLPNIDCGYSLEPPQ